MDNNVKISQLQQLTQMEAPKSQKATDEEFKFTLIRNIDKADLKEKLTGLMKDIEEQGEKIAKHMENFLDRRGRHRVYGIIRQVDKNLDDLAQELMKEEKDHLAILGKIDDIRGLLIDIST